MPWQELKPMDQKVLFIADYLRGSMPFSHLCEHYQVSRKTGYKWLSRYKSEGVDGLHEQSRKPHVCPHSIPHSLRKEIIALRQNSAITPGAKKIRALLATKHPDVVLPSISTIYNILHAEGLVHQRRTRKRVHPYKKPLRQATAPNELWSVDFKGQFKLSNGRWCYPLTVMDDYSRYLIGCESQQGTATTDTQAHFKQLFQRYGLPERIRSDNGVPFATQATGGLSALSIWWIKLGIQPERIAPGKPQQNGKHERMHRTLKQATVRPPCSSFKAQQKRFEVFKQAYNEQRPHEALALKTPAQCYQASTRAYPDKLPEFTYPSYFDVRKVRSSGVIYWRAGQVYISHLLKGEWAGLEEVNDGIFDVYFHFYKLGSFDVRQVSDKGVCPYWSLKV